ncbi:hypothetical protein K0M31_007392 [Melipona bicolor]|uniref:Uncharacterized protein n=1 Tax=Melipona bicolor TaxID=60889 RepID=A0AA40KVM7_9HYME|nr:hypothetical protein K0M31_007392 [Melipona bicolor]
MSEENGKLAQGRWLLEKLRYGSSNFTQGDRPIASVEIAGPRGAFLPDETGLGRRHVSLVSFCNENGFERSLPHVAPFSYREPLSPSDYILPRSFNHPQRERERER